MNTERQNAHPTRTSVGKRSRLTSLRTTRLFLRKQLWVWPLIAAVSLTAVAWVVKGVIEGAVKDTLAGTLETILEADVTALNLWLEAQLASVEAAAAHPNIAETVLQLEARTHEPGFVPTSLGRTPEMTALRSLLNPWIETQGYHGFLVVNMEGLVLAALRDGQGGTSDRPLPEGTLEDIQAGESLVTHPFPSMMLMEDAHGEKRVGLPTMFAFAPVTNKTGGVVAGLGLRIRPKEDFTRILQVARAGESGETYAFDAGGVMISASRFDDQLKQIGLLPDREDTQSTLNIQIRDPEVDMTTGARPAVRGPDRALTRMAQDAIAGNSGVDVDGYRDYRGVPVVGAWTWLEPYRFGVATEFDVAEAYRPLYILRTTFLVLFGLLAAGAVAIFIFTIVVARLSRAARQAAVESARLGQYALQEKIGSGGMGSVYRGHHDMLHRPTAIKLLDPEKTTSETIARFEREVQLTSQLKHPNTIAVYDFGRTPEGVFYYAMEYLDGINLEQLVARDGAQPEGRVIHILRQVCGSLAEAHEAGLIHRDIKPSNIILNCRGGVPDFAKLLDFGLVKAVDSEQQASLTVDGSLTGTPHYMAPESIATPNKVDARSDLYAVAAVGYFLLAGKPLFRRGGIVDICRAHIETEPVAPSVRLGRPVCAGLEELLLQCLAKKPDLRPASARDLERALRGCASAAGWDVDAAQAWWDAHAPRANPSDPDRTIVMDG